MPNDIKKLRRLMKTANYLKKENPVILHGAKINPRRALKYAWWFEKFRKQLQSGVYRFSFFKKDGSIREARGTLDFSLIPDEQKPKCQNEEMRKCENFSSFPYFDLSVKGWRSFRLDNFIGFVERV